MADIFLSYAREDLLRARQLAEALREQGWSVWWDRKIPYGQDFTAYIQKQLDDARCIVVLWSRMSVGSQFVRDEASEGLNGRLVPTLLDAVKPPLGFRQLQSADLSGWTGAAGHDEFGRVVESIAAIVPPPSRKSSGRHAVAKEQTPDDVQRRDEQRRQEEARRARQREEERLQSERERAAAEAEAVEHQREEERLHSERERAAAEAEAAERQREEERVHSERERAAAEAEAAERQREEERVQLDRNRAAAEAEAAQRQRKVDGLLAQATECAERDPATALKLAQSALSLAPSDTHAQLVRARVEALLSSQQAEIKRRNVEAAIDDARRMARSGDYPGALQSLENLGPPEVVEPVREEIDRAWQQAQRSPAPRVPASAEPEVAPDFQSASAQPEPPMTAPWPVRVDTYADTEVVSGPRPLANAIESRPWHKRPVTVGLVAAAAVLATALGLFLNPPDDGVVVTGVDYAAILTEARKSKDADPLGAIALIRRIPDGVRERAEAQEFLKNLRSDVAAAAAAARQKAVAANAMSQSAFGEGDRQLKQAEGSLDAEAAVPVFVEAARSFSRAATADLTPQQLFQVAEDALRNGKREEALDYVLRAYQRDSSYQPAIGFLNARRSDAAQQAESGRKKAAAVGATAENSATFKQALGSQQAALTYSLTETREAVAKFREATSAFERAEASAVAQAAQALQQQTQFSNEMKEAVGRADALLKSRNVAGAQAEIDRIRAKDPANRALSNLDRRLSATKSEMAKEAKEKENAVTASAVAKSRADVQELMNRSRQTLNSKEAIQLLEKAQGLDPANDEIRTELARRKAEAVRPIPPLAPSVDEVDRSSILEVLQAFGAAYKEKNSAGLTAVYPKAPNILTDVSLITSRDWAGHEAPEITITVPGAKARANWKVTTQMTHRRSGKEPAVNAVREFTLEKGPQGWKIVDYR